MSKFKRQVWQDGGQTIESSFLCIYLFNNLAR